MPSPGRGRVCSDLAWWGDLHADLRLSRDTRWTAGDQLTAAIFNVSHRYVAAVGGVAASIGVAFAGAAVALIVAIWLAYQTLYDGKPFGPWVGYFGALFAGIAASAVTDALFGGANWLRGALRAITKA